MRVVCDRHYPAEKGHWASTESLRNLVLRCREVGRATIATGLCLLVEASIITRRVSLEKRKHDSSENKTLSNSVDHFARARYHRQRQSS
ncbi:hypothetical protein NPIL_580991 [Nephila pilipes]|uniref:Uncharacterized protein n=1 Tax=Nephila pilipes TaxID=299642 RepID=A0A8X6PTJ8_NEPPI|nr:hypothetical protein NPIL_580991 [Nephila pilipes]